MNQRELNERLWWAARDGQTEKVEDYIERGADVNCKVGGRSPLFVASQYGHTETVSRLMDLGADINVKDRFGWSPLFVASMNGHTETVSRLVDLGADINAKDNEGKTPYDVSRNDDIRELLKKNMTTEHKTRGATSAEHTVQGAFKRKDHSVMLDRLLGEGSYESFDMRVMVTGQFGVGKTSLVMILVGDNVSKFRQATDGISLLEGRCGLGIDGKDWILIDKDEYNALDVVYNKVLMSQNESPSNTKTTSKAENQLQREPIDSPEPWREHPDTQGEFLYTRKRQEVEQKPSSSSLTKEIEARPKEEKRIQFWQHRKMRAKMTKDEIRKKMEMVLKSGKYQMKVGRLIFWDFGGQYVYYTTHQTFMTYRALYLVVFDGSKSLQDEVHDVMCFPGQHGTPTAAVFLQHWVNSILTYCKLIEPGIPKILFVATHKDKVPKAAVERTRNNLYNDIKELFKNYQGLDHLVLEPKLFVNATDKNDPEINTLKQIITDLTFKHPCWGERMPNTWVPLELEIAELAAEGKQILSLKEMEDLNKASEVSVLSKEDLKFFLHYQHSLGKIVYFDTPRLREFVIISPIFMVEVMKSLVTDEQFWPEDPRMQQLFAKMSTDGNIQKEDLFKVWRQPKFSEINKHKEFIFDMLIHLDILSEQRRYDIETGSGLPPDEYLVPCMLTRKNETSYMMKECTSNRAIGLAFVFKGAIIPPALPNRLISACLSMWSVKEYNGRRLLFSGFVAFSRDKFHDIVVCVESNRILVYMIHKNSKDLIVRDIATGVRECISTTLQRISEFYQSSISPKIPGQELPFHVEFACSNPSCYMFVSETDVVSYKAHVCPTHRKKVDVDVWYQNKAIEDCSSTCKGLSADALLKTPSDPEILRLSKHLSLEQVKQLVMHLGIKSQQCDDVHENHQIDVLMVKFLILVLWRDTKGTYKDLEDNLGFVGHTPHVLCRVRRMKRKPSDIPEVHLDSVPTDAMLDALAPEIGLLSFQLGIELGLSVRKLEVIWYNYARDLIAQTRQILYVWRNDKSVKATLGILQDALVNIGRGTECLKSVVDTLYDKKITFMNEQTDFMSQVRQTQHFSKQPVEHYKLSNVSTQRSLSANLPTPTGNTTEQTGSVSVAALRTKFEQMK